MKTLSMRLRATAENVCSRLLLSLGVGAVRAAVMGLLALLLGACSISTQPLRESEMLELARRESLRGEVDLGSSLTLSEALARAVWANSELELERYQNLLSEREWLRSRVAYWPLPTVSGTDVVRDKAPTTVYDNRAVRESQRFSSTLRWSLLDFAVGYVRSKQLQNDRYAAQEQWRKTLNKLLSETRLNYREAQLSAHHWQQVKPLLAQWPQWRQRLREYRHAGAEDPLPLLELERDLLQLRRELGETEQWVAAARVELAARLGVNSLAASLVDTEQPPLPRLGSLSSSRLEAAGLLLRPEVRQQMYAFRQRQWQQVRDFWSWLPNAEFFIGRQYDDNPAYQHKAWNQRGQSLVIDLLKFVDAYYARGVSSAALQTAQAERAAIALMIVKQVRLGALDYPVRRRSAEVVAEIFELEAERLALMRQRAALEPMDEWRRYRAQLQHRLSAISRDRAYLQALRVYESLWLAVGFDALPAGDWRDVEFATLERRCRALSQPPDLRAALAELPPLDLSGALGEGTFERRETP